MTRTLIIEDEPLAVRKLERLLEKSSPSLLVFKRLGSVTEAVQYLTRHASEVDLIFLDIHLGDGNCFEIFNQLDIEIPIIFTTAYDQYAIEAFQQNSVDYLLKPVTEASLSKAITKFEKYHNSTSFAKINYQELANYFKPAVVARRRFIVSAGTKIRSIALKEVAYFYSNQGNTYLTTTTDRSYDINFTLDKLLPTLDGNSFYRVNRKMIVNIQAIKEAITISRNKLRLTIKPTPKFDVFVSADRAVAFKRWLGE
ncbi:MAG: LytTR family DNA-binding domain-containing protein [Bacteroidota bacterium]